MKSLLLLSLMISTLCYSQDTLTKIDIISAAKILDVKYSEKEIDMMYPDVKDNIIDYKKMHALSLNNSVGMSLNQRLSQKQNSKQEKLKWTYDKKIKLPANQNDLSFFTINQLGSLLRNKKITSVEMTKFFINRLKMYRMVHLMV